MVAHFSGRDIGRYVDGEMGRDEALRLDRHLSECNYCRGRLEAEQRLALDLKSYFAMPLPVGAHADIPRAHLPLQVPAAAAAVLAVFLAYPTFSRDLQPPHSTGVSTVMPFNLGVQVDGGQSWSQLSVWTGFVVSHSDQSLDIRVGSDVLRIDLPAGTQPGAYPVGSAVVVRGSLLRSGVVSAVAVQQVAP